MMKILEYSQIKGSEIMNSRNREFDDIIQLRVSEIISRVVKGGDKALRELTKELDGADIDSLFVTKEELFSESKLSDVELEQALNVAASNIEKFHKAQIPVDIEVETSLGVKCFQRSLPVRRVGLYIPGGSAPLFSTLLMLAIPARIAGCGEIVICTPPDRNGKVNNIILYLANKLGIGEIIKVGGAQAIAAMAYGTESIRRVDKIFGPGNNYVACAKLQLSSRVAIDMVAGPSELMILADDSSIPEFIAADLLSQAEHGRDSQLSFLTTDKYLAEEVNRLLKAQLASLPRRSIAETAINNGFSIICSDIDEMVDFANHYGAEHLMISMKEPWSIANRIENAGSIFLGNFSPESAGDYASGTNHTLPTAGWTRSTGGISVDSFMHKITLQQITSEGLAVLGGTIEKMAEAEGLTAHKNAVSIRLGRINNGVK
mgnify:FL=1